MIGTFHPDQQKRFAGGMVSGTKLVWKSTQLVTVEVSPACGWFLAMCFTCDGTLISKLGDGLELRWERSHHCIVGFADVRCGGRARVNYRSVAACNGPGGGCRFCAVKTICITCVVRGTISKLISNQFEWCGGHTNAAEIHDYQFGVIGCCCVSNFVIFQPGWLLRL